MMRHVAKPLAFFLLALSSCDSQLPTSTSEPGWRPFVGSLESTVLAYPKQGIIVVFGSESNRVSKRNREEIGKIESRLPNVVLVYADATESGSPAAQVLKEQGNSVPANFLYDLNSGSWETLPEIVESSNLKEVFVRTYTILR